MRLHPGEVAGSGWRVARLTEIVDLLFAASPAVTRRPRVFAIDGRGGAGKSSIATRLQEVTANSAVVHTDDIAWWQAFFDWSDLIRDNVLEPLSLGRAVAYRPDAWRRRGRPGAIHVSSDVEVLWVEGTGIIRSELAGWIDASIWVQGDLDDQNRRLAARDGDTVETREHIREWLKEELPLLQREQPWRVATLVIDGTSSMRYDPDTEAVVASTVVSGPWTPTDG